MKYEIWFGELLQKDNKIIVNRDQKVQALLSLSIRFLGLASTAVKSDFRAESRRVTVLQA